MTRVGWGGRSWGVLTQDRAVGVEAVVARHRLCCFQPIFGCSKSITARDERVCTCPDNSPFLPPPFVFWKLIDADVIAVCKLPPSNVVWCPSTLFSEFLFPYIRALYSLTQWF